MRLLSLTLPTADVGALTDFYAGQLGLTIVRRTATAVTLAVGADLLTFERAAVSTAPFFHFAFDVPYAAVEAAANWLEGAARLLPADGRRIAGFPNWLARSAYVRDPAGNIVECIGRQPLPWLPAATPFTAAGLRGLSEIGVVVPDVPTFVADVRATYGLPVFVRQPPNDRFFVLGDDAGLLIVVPPGRAWFPTDVPSAVFPLTVELKAGPGRPPVMLRLP